MDIDTALAWRGKTVEDRGGEKIGKLAGIYLDGQTDRPAFAGVSTGLFGTRETFVPLAGAELVDDRVRLPYDKQRVVDAPRIEPDAALTAAEEEQLYRHYGQEYASRPEEGELVRSEEEVTFGKRSQTRRERVRLRKYLVTEEVEQRVPVRREEIRLETDPPEGRIVEESGVPEDDPRAG